jgi:hypothetical protein
MELSGGRVNSWLRAAIVIASDTFAEVVRLNLASGRAEVVSGPFPINFVLVVGQQDGATNDTRTRRCLHNNIDTTEEDVEVCPDVGSVIPLLPAEFGTIGAIGDSGIIGKNPTIRKCCLLSEVDEVFVLGKAIHWWA